MGKSKKEGRGAMRTTIVTFITAVILATLPNAVIAQKLPDDCSTVTAPKQALEVSVGGARFTPKTVKLRSAGAMSYGEQQFDSYRLSLRSEDEISPPMEAEVTFLVRKGQGPDGKAFRRLPTKEIGKQPAPIQGLPEVQGWSFKNRPAKGDFNHVEHTGSMRIEFGKRQGDSINGSIYLCVAKGQTTIFDKTPTKEDSYAVGTFQARIEQ
jgi:hypothetical protein